MPNQALKRICKRHNPFFANWASNFFFPKICQLMKQLIHVPNIILGAVDADIDYDGEVSFAVPYDFNQLINAAYSPPRSVDFWPCPREKKNSPSIPGFNRQLIGNGYLPLDTCSTKFEKVPSTNRNIMMAMMDQIEILDERATKPRSDCVQSPKLGLPTW